MDESALRWMEDGKARKDAAQAMSEDLLEQLAQAALQADGPHVAHVALLQRVLDQRHDDAGLPARGEGGCAQAAGEQSATSERTAGAAVQRQLPQAGRHFILAWRRHQLSVGEHVEQLLRPARRP